MGVLPNATDNLCKQGIPLGSTTYYCEEVFALQVDTQGIWGGSRFPGNIFLFKALEALKAIEIFDNRCTRTTLGSVVAVPYADLQGFIGVRLHAVLRYRGFSLAWGRLLGSAPSNNVCWGPKGSSLLH